jgi:NAD(P)H-dependent FMN reductase
MAQTADEPPLEVAVIIGRTREGRVGDRIGRWFADQAQRHGDVAVTVVDLATFAFPARYPVNATLPMTEFAAAIGRADAFVVVTPEYNHSFPASLKQAIDYAYDEWQAKPVGFVSYGCRSEGMHAVDQLRTVFTALHAVTMRDGVGVDLLVGNRQLDPECELDTERLVHAARTMLNELRWWGLALRDARAARPYVS